MRLKTPSPAKAGWSSLGQPNPGLAPGATDIPPLRGSLTRPTTEPMAEPDTNYLKDFLICVICGPPIGDTKTVRAARSVRTGRPRSQQHVSSSFMKQHAGDVPSSSLLPNDRIAPQQMLFYPGAGKDFGAENADFFHRRINVVALVSGPGIAGGAAGKQAAVVN